MASTNVTKDAKGSAKGGKPRVYALAAELNVDTKTVLEHCRELGYKSITSQLKALEPEQVDAIRERIKNPAKPSAKSRPAPAAPSASLPLPAEKKIRTLTPPKAAPKPTAKPAEPEPTPEPEAPAPIVETPVPVAKTPPPPFVPPKPAKVPVMESKPAPKPTPKPIEEAPKVQPEPKPEPVAPPPAAEVKPAEAKPEVPPTPARPAPMNRPPNLNAGSGRMPNLSGRPQNLGNRPPQRPQRPTPTPPPAPTAPSTPTTGHAPPRVAPPTGTVPPRTQRTGNAPPNRFGPNVGRPAGTAGNQPAARGGKGGKPAPATNTKQIKLTAEQIQKLRDTERSRGKVSIKDIQDKNILTNEPVNEAPKEKDFGPDRTARPRPDRGGDDGSTPGNDDRRGGGSKRPGEVPGRDSRHRARQDTNKGRGGSRGGASRSSVIIGSGGKVEVIEEHRGSRLKKHRGMKRNKRQATVITGKIEIVTPITVRSLSTAIGMKVGELLIKLKNATNSLYTINSNIDFEVAELIAVEQEVELVEKKQETAEDIVVRQLQEAAEQSDEENMVLRAPIVTIMGHVDHGKTSLLDRIRQEYGHTSDVVSTETGGITQVLRAWQVSKDGRSTTFLDTPGHEAFTKMRARGANVTDIAVIVVSAADGVMPQTEEAISHAKAAEVDIIVAINKVDLPDANIDRARRQLYSLDLLPDNMGGEVPFIECSAKTGQGIDELLDNIATLAEFAELKADPTLAASGTCLEAYLEGEKGVVATMLIENGTLRQGDVVLCGSTYGRVRAMYDDLGQPIQEAGPSTPIKFIGLNEVPEADDPFFAMQDVATARQIANKRQAARQEANLSKFSPVSLDALREQNTRIKISELKVILKAEARGSVEAIRKELEKLTHEEVRVRVLHAGIGAITESDLTLAMTSPDDTMILGFNVTADDKALQLAEQRGMSDKIREYQIIYNLVDDVKAALEGRLKPVEEVVHLGRAVVRETFRITKVGTIAGCYVTSGTIERNAKVRLIREGTVLFPPAEKTASLDSLKRFKDDAKEVREGFECGMKIAGFDDIKVGDVIEAYRIEIRQRTL